MRGVNEFVSHTVGNLLEIWFFFALSGNIQNQNTPRGCFYCFRGVFFVRRRSAVLIQFDDLLFFDGLKQSLDKFHGLADFGGFDHQFGFAVQYGNDILVVFGPV